MAIQKRSGVNPTTMAANWAKGVGVSGAKWIAGVESPRNLPNADPVRNTSNWTSGVAAAAPLYNAGISNPAYLDRLDKGAKAKQGSYTGSGTAHQADALSSFEKLAPIIQAGVNALPPKGPRGTNEGRSSAFAQYMH